METLYTHCKEFVKKFYITINLSLIERRLPMEPGGIVLIALVVVLVVAAIVSNKKSKQNAKDQTEK